MISEQHILNLAECRAVFDLDKAAIQSNLLALGSSWSSFAAELTQQGGSITCMDALYDTSNVELPRLAEQAWTEFLQEVAECYSEELVAAHKREWRASMMSFIEDYAAGQKAGRYIDLNFDHLAGKTFDIALCINAWHPAQHNDSYFQLQTLQTIFKHAQEVRVFPLLDRSGKHSVSLGPLLKLLQDAGFAVEVRQIEAFQDYPSNAMLRVWRTECAVG